jgi:hypothetical protein
MRNALLTCVAWLGALQSWRAPGTSLEDSARGLGVAGLLGTLTVLIYRLGVWRQEMENTRNNVAAEVKAHREESAANFDRLDRRLEAIDHMVAASAEDRARSERRHARAERRIDRLEHIEFDDDDDER